MSKLSIKMGTIQVDYEGTDEFIKRDLLGLLTSISTLVGKTDSDEEAEDEEPTAPHNREKGKTGKLQMTTGSIASKLDCKSGPDLVISACAYLTFMKDEP
ncbi:MAG TPA: hypothetical protein DEO33_05955, partial [Rikenellaceae bacterium]|nr:hypothetical protein [Rikenellaceae bacterium]